MSYRRSYVDKTNGRFYLCAYCGKPMSKDKMTVDHLVPQNLFRKFQRMVIIANVLALSILGAGIYTHVIETSLLLYYLPLPIVSFGLVKAANTYKDSRANLVAACQPCNSSKSDNIDLRILRGFIFNVLFSKVGLFLIIGAAAYLFLTGKAATLLEMVK